MTRSFPTFFSTLAAWISLLGLTLIMASCGGAYRQASALEDDELYLSQGEAFLTDEEYLSYAFEQAGFSESEDLEMDVRAGDGFNSNFGYVPQSLRGRSMLRGYMTPYGAAGFGPNPYDPYGSAFYSGYNPYDPYGSSMGWNNGWGNSWGSAGGWGMNPYMGYGYGSGFGYNPYAHNPYGFNNGFNNRFDVGYLSGHTTTPKLLRGPTPPGETMSRTWRSTAAISSTPISAWRAPTRARQRSGTAIRTRSEASPNIWAYTLDTGLSTLYRGD